MVTGTSLLIQIQIKSGHVCLDLATGFNRFLKVLFSTGQLTTFLVIPPCELIIDSWNISL
jgi:hypothetical protein